MTLNKPTGEITKNQQLVYSTARGVAFISAIALLVILCLFFVSYQQIKAAPPTDSKVMLALIERVKSEPQNEALIQEVRALDVMARRAQFQWFAFAKRGGILIAAALISLFGALKVMSRIKQAVPAPGSLPEDDSRSLARWSVLGATILIALFGFGWVRTALPELPDAKIVENATAANPDTPPMVAFPSEAELMAAWPAFRGHQGLGVSTTAILPTEWDGAAGTNIAWKTNIPLPGFNSPVAWGGRLLCTGANESTRTIYCLDAKAGNILWTVDLPAAPKNEDVDISSDTGYAASTMACNGVYAYAVFAGGELACVDLDGKIIWQKSLGFPNISYGFASSLRCYMELLFLQLDQEESGALIALDARTGDQVWRQQRGMEMCWSTPVIAELGGKMQLILNGNPEVRSYDPLTGKQLWQWDGMGGEVATSPAVGASAVFLAQEYAQAACLSAEGKAIWTDDQIDMPDVASPVALGDLVFIPTNSGILTCISLTDGSIKWKHEFAEGFYASPIIVGDKLLVIDRKGNAHIMTAQATYEEIANPKLGEPVVCTPVPVGNRLYLRSSKHIYCIRQK